MITAYFDASVILRVVLEQDPRLENWETLELGVSSNIVRVECSRALVRLRLEGKLDDAALEQKRVRLHEMIQPLELVAVDTGVIRRASQPFPAHVATLDAIHLATAVLYRAAQPPDDPPLLFATHDLQLARAARAMHFEVLGA